MWSKLIYLAHIYVWNFERDYLMTFSVNINIEQKKD